MPEASALAMVDGLAKAQLIEVAGAGHDVHLDQPEQWRTLLRSFIESLDDSPS